MEWMNIYVVIFQRSLNWVGGCTWGSGTHCTAGPAGSRSVYDWRPVAVRQNRAWPGWVAPGPGPPGPCPAQRSPCPSRQVSHPAATPSAPRGSPVWPGDQRAETWENVSFVLCFFVKMFFDSQPAALPNTAELFSSLKPPGLCSGRTASPSSPGSPGSHRVSGDPPVPGKGRAELNG